MNSENDDGTNGKGNQKEYVGATEEMLMATNRACKPCGNNDNSSSLQGGVASGPARLPTSTRQSKQFEKRVAAFLDAKYSNRPKVVGGLDYYLEPDLPGGAHLVVKGHGAGDIYLGPKTAANPKSFDSIDEALESMRAANITGIVNCTTHVPCYFRGRLSHIKYCVIPEYDEDAADLLQYFLHATTFMHLVLSQEGCSVLVHCEVGVSRSSSVVMAYLMRFHGMSRDDAYLAVKKRRPKVNPNQGFWKQLELFEAQIAAKSGVEKHLLDDRLNEDEVELVCDERKMIRECYLLYVACRDMMGNGATDSNCFRWLLPPSSSTESSSSRAHYTQCLAMCVELVWTHCVLAIDVEWLVFCCQEVWRRQESGLDPWDVQVIIEGILTNPDSEFLSTWEGRISPRQVQKVLVALDESARSC